MFFFTQQEDSLFASMPPLCPIGSHPKVQSPKAVTGGLGAFTKVSVCHSIAPETCGHFSTLCNRP